MTNWLIKHFVLAKYGDDKKKQRLLTGRLSGTTGIILYAALGLVKVFIGIATGSFAVIADAVHNLADAAASIATLIGFTLAGKKSDAEHPFGHARYEYMTGFVVSAIIIGIGINLIMTAIEKVQNPEPLVSDTVSVILLLIMILATIWFFVFNMKLSKLIGSPSLKATGVEARNDAISTAAVLGVILLHQFVNINIDGFVGFAIGAVIIYSGLRMIKETAGPLLGESPDPKTVSEIAELVLGHEGVLGIHDLIVHDYGPGHIFASVHVELDSREDIFKSHAIVDDIEKKAQEELNVFLVGHMDPLDTQNPKIKEILATLRNVLGSIENVVEIHDLRIVTGQDVTKVIFDIVAAHKDSEETFGIVEEKAQEALSKMDPKYVVVINRDLAYNTKGNAEEKQSGKENA